MLYHRPFVVTFTSRKQTARLALHLLPFVFSCEPKGINFPGAGQNLVSVSSHIRDYRLQSYSFSHLVPPFLLHSFSRPSPSLLLTPLCSPLLSPSSFFPTFSYNYIICTQLYHSLPTLIHLLPLHSRFSLFPSSSPFFLDTSPSQFKYKDRFRHYIILHSLCPL